MAEQSVNHVNVSDDAKNEIKLMLLRRKMTKCVRKKLHKILPKDGIQLYQELYQHRDHYKHLMRKGHLTKKQFDTLFPPSQTTQSSEFDAPLIIKVLFTEKLCGYKHPGRGWKPLPSNGTDVANFIRIDLARHKMQHLGENVDQAKIDEIFNLVQPALLHFNITQEEIDEIRNYDVEASGAKFLPKDFTWNLIKPVANFIGREEKIQEIHDKLKVIDQTKQKSAVVVYGLPGVGKTETIRKYCKDFSTEKYYDSIVWINAQSMESIENCFNDLATKLKIPKEDGSGKKTSRKVIVDSVYSMLTVQKEDKISRHVLFVFDNINNMQEIGEFLPSTQQNSPFIIATTQSQQWDNQHFEKIHLDVFNEDLSDKFLENELQSPASKTDRHDLLSSLQHHPLALQQAVSYINLNDMSIHDFLKIYNSNDWSILLGEGTHNMFQGKSVYITFSIAVKRLEKERKLIELMKILAYLDGVQIKEALIKNICNNDILETNRILNILQNYSLINRRKGIQDNQGIITVHSLVQRTIKSHIEGKGETNKYIDICFQLVQDDFSSKKVMKERGNQMFSHFLYLSDEKNMEQRFIEKCLEDDYYDNLYIIFEKYHQEETFVKLCMKLLEYIKQRDIETMHMFHIKKLIALSFKSLGQYDMGLKHLNEILQTLPDFSDENPTEFSLAVQHDIALCLDYMGKYEAALELFKEVERKRSQILGERHPDLLCTQHYIALCLQDLGKYEEALQLDKEVERKRSQILVEMDPELLMTQHNIAQCLQIMGKSEEALELYKEVERKQLQSLGETHPHVLTAQHNIASCLLQMERNEEALELFKEVEKKRLQILRETHHELLTTQHNIASCLRQMGKYKEALELFKEVEKKILPIMREMHSLLLNATQQNIALCLQQMGKYGEALELFKEVEKKRLQILGKTHPEMLTTQNNIANCLQEMGNYKESLKLFKEVERKQLQILGESNSKLLTTQHNIASCLQEMGKYEEALKLFKEVERKQLPILGERHSKLLTTQHNIALCFRQMGKNTDALELFKEVERERLQILGKSHPEILTTQHNIAYCFQEMRNYERALELFREVERKRLQILGETHPKLLTTQHNIALCRQQMRNNEEALELFKEVERKQLQILGETHPEMLTTQHNIAKCFQEMGKYEEALELFEEVERKRLQILGKSHPEILTTQHNIACCLQNMGKYEKAFNIFTDVEKRLILDHSLLLTNQFNKACCLYSMNRREEAIDVLKIVELQQIKSLGDQHPDVIHTQTVIAKYSKTNKQNNNCSIQ